MFGGKASPHGEATANALGNRHNIGDHTGPFMGKQFAGAANTALHFVEYQHKPMFIRQRAKPAQALRRNGADAAFALDGFNEDGGGFICNRGFQRLMISKRHLIKAIDLGAEAFEIFRLASGCNRGEGAPVEGTFKGNDPVAFGFSGVGLEFAGHFDGAFQGLCTRIGEKHGVGETGVRQPPRQAFLARNFIEIGRMP